MSESHTFSSIPAKILLPIDFSPSSQAALEMAADLALHFHAELYLVNVIGMFPTTTLPDFVPGTDLIQKASANAERQLANCRKILAEKASSQGPVLKLETTFRETSWK
jgi:nucleotide-binding universal stress UspA family protein